MLRVIQDQIMLLKRQCKAHFIKSVKGFGNTAGIQCACNSLYALCWSGVEKGICMKKVRS